MEMPCYKAGIWPTEIEVQCRSEDPFKAKIRFHPIKGRGLVPKITCPHCGRDYFLQPDGEWLSDRALVILK